MGGVHYQFDWFIILLYCMQYIRQKLKLSTSEGLLPSLVLFLVLKVAEGLCSVSLSDSYQFENFISVRSSPVWTHA